jgi:hypothetical protein
MMNLLMHVMKTIMNPLPTEDWRLEPHTASSLHVIENMHLAMFLQFL